MLSKTLILLAYKTEAEWSRAIAIERDALVDVVTLEDMATNTSENILFTK